MYQTIVLCLCVCELHLKTRTKKTVQLQINKITINRLHCQWFHVSGMHTKRKPLAEITFCFFFVLSNESHIISPIGFWNCRPKRWALQLHRVLPFDECCCCGLPQMHIALENPLPLDKFWENENKKKHLKKQSEHYKKRCNCFLFTSSHSIRCSCFSPVWIWQHSPAIWTVPIRTCLCCLVCSGISPWFDSYTWDLRSSLSMVALNRFQFV